MKPSTPSALRCALVLSAASMCTALLADTATSSSTTRAATNDHQAMSSTNKSMTADLSRSDRNFFEKAAKSGMKEVSVSQATMDRLMNPQAKAFAQMMVSDHSKANSELMELAAKKGVTLPPKGEEVSKLSDKWSKKTKELDEDYIEEMVDDHQEAVDLFEKASKSDDAEIAAFARKTLPTLQHHLTMAKDLKKALD